MSSDRPASRSSEVAQTAGGCSASEASGELAHRPLPDLLVDLYRARSSGNLRLRSARRELSIAFNDGAPASATSSAASEGLCSWLVAGERLAPAAAQRAEQIARERNAPEAAVLLGLKLIEPAALVQAIRAHLRTLVLEAFAWHDGTYQLEPTPARPDLKPFCCHPLPLIVEGLASRWGIDRLARALTSKLELFPRLARDGAALRRHLPADPALDALLARCDGSVALGRTLGAAATSPTLLASLYVLERVGALAFDSHAATRSASDSDLEFEIEASATPADAPIASPPTRPNEAAPSNSSAPLQTRDGESDKLRREIEELHAQLGDLTLYALLGVAESEKTPAIKKAYLKAAKRYHPDALGRMGLADLKPLAGEIFARVSEAHAVLGDPQRRAEYDAELTSGMGRVDAAVVAQAESLYRKGEVLLRMGDFRGSLEFLTRAVELWPEECAYQAALGWALHRKSPPESERALGHLERAVALNAKDPVAHFRLGSVLKALGQAERSAEHLALAKRLDPKAR